MAEDLKPPVKPSISLSQVLAGEAMLELTEAMTEIYQLVQALGANDEAEAQKTIT